MSHKTAFETNCPIARVTEILGQGWALLVLREAFLGTRHFNDFERELSVARNILSARLKKLVEAGLLERVRSTEDRRAVEYRLSEAGRALLPSLVALSQWASQWLCDCQDSVRFIERESGEEIPPVTLRNRRGEPLDISDITMRAGPDADETLRHRYARAFQVLKSA